MAATAKKTTATPARRRNPAAKTAPKAPANAKKPADHRPAKQDVEGRGDITVEWHGHKYTIEGEAFNDLEVVDLFMQLEDAPNENVKTQIAVRVSRRLLAGDVYNQYLANERGKDGRVTLTGFIEFFNHIMEQVDQGNS